MLTTYTFCRFGKRGQFNLVVPETDLKWDRIHPRQVADGCDFRPADAFVNFGLTNQMDGQDSFLVRRSLAGKPAFPPVLRSF